MATQNSQIEPDCHVCGTGRGICNRHAKAPRPATHYTKADIEAKVSRQRAVLARIRDLDATAIDIVISRLSDAFVSGQGREDLVAALYLVAHRDDVYDALANQRQAEVLLEDPRQPDPNHLVAGIVRIGYVSQAMVEAVEHIVESAIGIGDSKCGAYDFFLLWAGACRHRWLWEIVQTAHKHSVASRRSP